MAEERIPLIETVDLKKYFKVGDKSFLHAVDGINMKVYAGETIGVVGESGCGKSTLGRTILRLIEPTSGQILYNGDDITKYNTRQMKKMRQELQIIFQDPYASLDPRKSVIEIIAEYMIINKTLPKKREIFNRAAHLMDVVGLARRYATAVAVSVSALPVRCPSTPSSSSATSLFPLWMSRFRHRSSTC